MSNTRASADTDLVLVDVPLWRVRSVHHNVTLELAPHTVVLAAIRHVTNLHRQGKSFVERLPFVRANLYQASFERIQAFAMSPELGSVSGLHEQKSQEQDDGVVTRINIENGEFRWDPKVEEPTLSGINIKIRDRELAMVVGTVGSGKSSLCMAMLGEIPKTRGSISITGNVALVAQEVRTAILELNSN